MAEFFVGRERELEEFCGALDQVAAGRGRLVLLAGEPGIGKTRLAEEVARLATDRGARVLWGRSWEGGGAPPCWPWVQALRTCVRQEDPATLASLLGSAGPYVAAIVPEIAERIPTLAGPATLETDDARFALFDAVTEFLRKVAARHPLVLVLDDLHAADRSSLLLLRFLARETRETPILAIGIHRDVEARLSPAADLFQDLGREATRIALRGLSAREVERFVERAALRTTPILAARIHRHTEGNPLFVDQILRLLAAEGRDADEAAVVLGLPDAVRDTITRRLGFVSPAAREVLSAAAVLGKDFELAALERVTGTQIGELAKLVSEGAAAGILRAAPGILGHASFDHSLFREALYEALSPAARRILHREAAEAIEELHAADLDVHLSRLAHHWAEAAAGAAERERAADYARRAGDRALALLAYDEASEHYGRAAAISQEDRGDPERRCELLLALGESLRKAGVVRRTREVLLEAAALARSFGSPEKLARAALAYGSGVHPTSLAHAPNESLIRLLEEANGGFGGKDHPLRVRVLSRLALELYWTDETERQDALSSAAVEMAERVGDAGAHLLALYNRSLVRWGPDGVEERLAAAADIVRLAEESGDRVMALKGRYLRVRTLEQLGDSRTAEREARVCARIAEELRVKQYRRSTVAIDLTRAIREGRFERAEALAAEFVSLSDRADEETLTQVAVQLTFIRFLQGRWAEAEPNVRSFVERLPWIPGYRAVLAYAMCELGRDAESRTEFERLAAADFTDVPRNDLWLVTMLFLSWTCARLGDVARAALLYRLLVPFSTRSMVIGAGQFGYPVASILGTLAATCARWSDAFDWFEKGLAHMRAMGNRPFLALTLRDYAEALVARGRPEEASKAQALADEGLVMMREIGMSGGHVHRLEAYRRRAEATLHAGAGLATLSREGGFWTLAYEGRSHRLKDVKGLRHLAHLVARPHEEWHVLDLVAAVEGVSAEGGSPIRGEVGLCRTSLRDAGALLDDRAKNEYRRRLAELREEAGDARAIGDAPRAEAAEEEMDALGRELAAAVGLRGRDRKLGSPAERARVNVARTIKSAIELIAEACPQLGAHLGDSVHTGTFCVYLPDPRGAIRWDVSWPA